jgi:hypothetical protein
MNLSLHFVFHRTKQTEEQYNGFQQSYGRYAAHRPPSTVGKVSVSLIATEDKTNSVALSLQANYTD